MFHTRKLKPDRSIGGALVPLAIVLIFGLSALVFDIPVALLVFALMVWVYALYSLYVFIRTGNLGHLAVCLYQVFLGLMAALASLNFEDRLFPDARYGVAWITGVVVFGIIIVYLVATKKIKWRGREVFELAAESVEQVGNGYTPRPRPVGKVEFTKQEILAFARFVTRNLIAIAFVGPKGVTFVPVKMGDEFTYLLRMRGSFLDATWISFDFDGDVSVHISQKDYLDYSEALAFDKLCVSLGGLFVEIAGLHQRGEGVRIIDRMDALRLSIFS